MKRILVILFTLFLTAGCTQKASDGTDSELKLELTASTQTVMVGDKVSFTAFITNFSERPVKVMRSRDGSDVGWVMPKIKVNVWGPDHQLIASGGVGRCGNVNPLIDEDIYELKPGEQFDVFGPGSSGHYKLRRFSPIVPGTYVVKMVYETTGKARRGLGDDGNLPNGVAAVRLVSNPVEIKVLSTKTGKDKKD